MLPKSYDSSLLMAAEYRREKHQAWSSENDGESCSVPWSIRRRQRRWVCSVWWWHL